MGLLDFLQNNVTPEGMVNVNLQGVPDFANEVLNKIINRDMLGQQRTEMEGPASPVGGEQMMHQPQGLAPQMQRFSGGRFDMGNQVLANVMQKAQNPYGDFMNVSRNMMMAGNPFASGLAKHISMF